VTPRMRCGIHVFEVLEHMDIPTDTAAFDVSEFRFTLEQRCHDPGLTGPESSGVTLTVHFIIGHESLRKFYYIRHDVLLSDPSNPLHPTGSQDLGISRSAASFCP